MKYKTGDQITHDGFQAELIKYIGEGYWIVDTKTWGWEEWHEEDFKLLFQKIKKCEELIMTKKTKIEYCNDCKRDSVFDINEDQDAKYRDGERLRECIKCGRYESEVVDDK